MPVQLTPAMRSPLSINTPRARGGRSESGGTDMARGALNSQALLRGNNEVLIRHGGEVYRLRHTRNDKLILTK